MNIYLLVILSVLLGGYFISCLVESLNLAYLKTELPNEFQGYYDSEKYKKSQEYLRDKTKFSFAADGVSCLATAVFILAGGFNFVDSLARSLDLPMIITGILFAGMLMLLSQIISLPFSIYNTFVIEQKYGFNQTTPKTFILDIIKGWFLAAVIGAPIFACVLWFFAHAGGSAWVYCWLATAVFQLILYFIAPALIMPLFNRFTPLADGELKTAIENYARQENFQMQGVFVMDGSRRSAKSNAFFTGFGKFRRIALFDTLIAKHSVDELVAVLAHEIGHYKKKHILKHLAVSLAALGAMFFILSLFINNRQLFAAFKMENLSIYAGLFFFVFLYAPISGALGVIENIFSRKHEYEADAFAAKTFGKPQALIEALKKLSVNNLSNLTPHPLKVFLDYSHPPVLDRIRALK